MVQTVQLGHTTFYGHLTYFFFNQLFIWATGCNVMLHESHAIGWKWVTSRSTVLLHVKVYADSTQSQPPAAQLVLLLRANSQYKKVESLEHTVEKT